MFAWPLVIDPPADFAHTRDAPFVFALILPVLVAIVLAEMTSRGMDTKALAMLGVLSAIGAALRPLGAGTGGIELVFFLLVLGGRVYGPAFGFVLGSTTLFASALLTGGMGPWLPFQMLASSWVGLLRRAAPAGARAGPRSRCWPSTPGCRAYLYGFLVNLWGWPFALGTDTALSYVPGAPVLGEPPPLRPLHARHVAPGAGTRAGPSPTSPPCSSSAAPCSPPCAGPPARRPSTPPVEFGPAPSLEPSDARPQR